ncbi:phage tail protein [Photorhabdus namnaonensis]|uniref:Phage Tail Collar Domain protein n=1 Tax=Photorhabdus namnaonensis TaxID=1851568 RepID=A0A1B8YJ09_9GAMM|nr:phage tail protein [Photorhabdus namnaonensis]OCA55128.1 Phage Tail Collar Domain protein [Photorhabdus namnaonensis]
MSSYNAGTVSIANSDILIGTGTHWKDNKFGVAPAQTILIKVGNDFKLSAIKNINSDTELVLIDKFPYSVSNAEYFIQTSVPNTYSDAARKVTAQLKYTDELLFNLNKWMTESGVVYITTPEGKTIQLKSIDAMTSKIAELQKNSVSQDWVDSRFARGNVSYVDVSGTAPKIHFLPPDDKQSRGAFVIRANLSNDYQQSLEVYKRDANRDIIYSINFPMKSGTLATVDDVNVVNNYPVGAPIPWPSNYPPTSKNYLMCRGQEFDKSLFPNLAEAYPNGKLPDLRGEFIRGWDGSRGADPGRYCGTWQGDAIQELSGVLDGGNNIGLMTRPHDNTSGVFSEGDVRTMSYVTQNEISYAMRFDAFRVARTANETRPRNIAFNYIVRAV